MSHPNPVTPEMTAAVGKTFTIKDASGDSATRRFKVVKLIERMNFGVQAGGRQPGLVVHRLDKDAEHTPAAAEFLAGHVVVDEPKK